MTQSQQDISLSTDVDLDLDVVVVARPQCQKVDCQSREDGIALSKVLFETVKALKGETEQLARDLATTVQDRDKWKNKCEEVCPAVRPTSEAALTCDAKISLELEAQTHCTKSWIADSNRANLEVHELQLNNKAMTKEKKYLQSESVRSYNAMTKMVKSLQSEKAASDKELAVANTTLQTIGACLNARSDTSTAAQTTHNAVPYACNDDSEIASCYMPASQQ